MPFKWTKAPSEVFPAGYEAWAEAIRDELVALAEGLAGEIVREMQTDAPWEDRTGLARESLYAEVVDMTHQILIAFGHGVEYGKFLETVRAGSLGIVGPTLDKWSIIVWNRVQQLLG